MKQGAPKPLDNKAVAGVLPRLRRTGCEGTLELSWERYDGEEDLPALWI